LLRASSGTILAIFIEIGSYMTEKEQKISWHSFFETRCTTGLAVIFQLLYGRPPAMLGAGHYKMLIPFFSFSFSFFQHLIFKVARSINTKL